MKDMVRSNKIRQSVIVVVVAVVLIATIVFYNQAGWSASGNRDNTTILGLVVPTPVFSKESGFYDQSFCLELSSPPNTKIFYTLDCNDPDETSILYEDPILIENITETANTYSMLTNVSTGFYSDLLTEFQTQDRNPQYRAPDYPVRKCVVVRAIAVDEKGNRSDIKTKSYFVDDSQSFRGCNIISAVTDPDNLFSDSTGIYVTGDVFENYILKQQVASYWMLWNANYKQKGEDWERPVDFECFNQDGELLLSTNGGIRVQGGISRATLPRSLNLFIDETRINDGETNDRLFESGFIPTKLNLFAGGNKVITLFNDYMMADRTQTLQFSKMTYKPYVLFLEGEYWGFYWMTNAYNERYISYNYDVAEDDVIIIKNGAVEVGRDIDILHYDNMKNFIKNNDMANSDNYSRACELIDIESYLDYYACLAYIARNEDWPSDNFALWRTKTAGNGYGDGKWRWMLFDSNSAAMTEDLIEHDTLNYILEEDAVFRSLWANYEFRLTFQNKILTIADTCFDAQEMSDYIDDYTARMMPILSESWDRFYGSENNKEETYTFLMEQHREFFNKRKDVVVSWFQ